MHLPVRTFALACVVLLAAGRSLGPSEPRKEPLPEYHLKAKLLKALTEYVAWPADDRKDLAFLTVIGESPFEHYLETVLSSGGTRKTICYARRPALACKSKVLFICQSELAILPQLLRSVEGQPVLTVGDTPGFAQQGVMANLIYQDERVVLEVNWKAFKKARLELSPHLLRLAKRVDEEP